MGLILLEALGALLLLVLIVWWTMFSGRAKGELVAPPMPKPNPLLGPADAQSSAGLKSNPTSAQNDQTQREDK
jgi:hypothetical protein